MNIEDDEGPDPDYGIWGDKGMETPRTYDLSPEALRASTRRRKRREAEEKVSRDFNSYMIQLTYK